MILPSCGERELVVHRRLNCKARQHVFSLSKWKTQCNKSCNIFGLFQIVFISAVKQLIAINRIQNKSFCVYVVYVCVMYIFIMYIYKYTPMHVYI